MKKIAWLPLLFMLAGCGNFYSVKVPYYLPESDNIIKTQAALSSLYIAIKAPPEPDESLMDNIAGGLMNGQRAQLDTNELAEKIALVFSKPNNKVLAYRVFRTKEESDPYIRYFDPSGVLELKISDLAISAKVEVRKGVYFDAIKNVWATADRGVWIYSASIGANIRLSEGAGGKVLDKFSDTFTWTEERPDNYKIVADWYAENKENLFGALTAKLAKRYLGRPVFRARRLFRKKGDPESGRAADLAESGKWGEAEALWSGRLRKKKDWRDFMDLAVAAEMRKDYASARSYYLGARESSAGDKEAGQADWGAILGDLDIMLSTGSAARSGGNDWFAGTAAILPFTDETTSIDGPPLIRALLQESLKAAGYRLQPSEETDKLLLSHGLTQGGQLGAADQAEICGWLGVDRLFYGDINEFGEVIAGVYNRRMIKGRIMLWDLKAGSFIWALDAQVIKFNTPKSFLAGMVPRLTKSLVERLKNNPMAYEASVFSAKAAEALPERPGIK